MNTDDISEVVISILMIISGYIIFEILFGDKKEENAFKKAERMQKKAIEESFKKMKREYPELSNG